MNGRPPELRLSDSDIATGRLRLASREADEPDTAPRYVPSQVRAIISLGSPTVWAGIWGGALLAVLAFSVWQSVKAPNAGTEFVEWTVAFLISLGPLLLGITFGFLAAAPLVRRGYWFFGIVVLVLLLGCGIFSVPVVKAQLPAQSPGTAAKEKMIWDVMKTFDFKRRGQ
jgi:hypothetical protein